MPRPTTVAVPHLVRVVRQSGWHADCGVAALAMLCGVLYEEALAAFADPIKVLSRGADWKDLRPAAARLVVATKVKYRYDITEDTGILHVSHPTKDEHLVFLWAGRVVDGNGELWSDPEVYLKHYGYVAKGLLVAA